MLNYLQEYEHWKKQKLEDPDLKDELDSLVDDTSIRHNFRTELVFGTAGIRGIMGVGPKRLNIYVIRRVTYGLAKWIKTTFRYDQHKSVVIAYDSRNKSRLFAEEAARVLINYGIHVYIYRQIMPTPLCSWGIRFHKSQAGIMITASHNPKEYNGYKVYDRHGCQLTNEPADQVYKMMQEVDYFAVKPKHTFATGIKKGLISYVTTDCISEYYRYIDSLSINKSKNKFIKIVYTPLNGTGLVPVTKVLQNAGFKDIYVVKEQEKPDGNFPTCPKPNPENPDAIKLMNKYLKELKYDIALATDPDCDRVAISVLTKSGKVRTFSGNEAGVLLFDYVVRRKMSRGTLPRDPVLVKTIVSTNMVFPIARRFGVHVKEVLTGFKYIGEQIHELELKHQADRFILGFEESIGFLTGTQVRDKDAVNASLLFAEMCDEYNKMGFDLSEWMDALYKMYGYTMTITDSYEFKSMDGMDKMKKIMDYFRNNYTLKNVSGLHAKLDCLTGVKKHYDGYSEKYDLPKSDVLCFYFAHDIKISIRPSGTEPKLKIYYYISADEKKELPDLLEKYKKMFDTIVQRMS